MNAAIHSRIPETGGKEDEGELDSMKIRGEEQE
jgi:hypothetical protein